MIALELLEYLSELSVFSLRPCHVCEQLFESHFSKLPRDSSFKYALSRLLSAYRCDESNTVCTAQGDSESESHKHTEAFTKPGHQRIKISAPSCSVRAHKRGYRSSRCQAN